jgi:hypothetical protein
MSRSDIDKIDKKIDKYRGYITKLAKDKYQYIQKLSIQCYDCKVFNSLEDWILLEATKSDYLNEETIITRTELICPGCFSRYRIIDKNKFFIDKCLFNNILEHNQYPGYRQPYVRYVKRNGLDHYKEGDFFDLSEKTYNESYLN